LGQAARLGGSNESSSNKSVIDICLTNDGLVGKSLSCYSLVGKSLASDNLVGKSLVGDSLVENSTVETGLGSETKVETSVETSIETGVAKTLASEHSLSERSVEAAGSSCTTHEFTKFFHTPVSRMTPTIKSCGVPLSADAADSDKEGQAYGKN